MRRASVALLAVAALLLFAPPAAAELVPAGGEFAISTPTVGVNPSPEIAANALGETVVLWLGDCDGFGVCARAYDALGAALGPERRLDISAQLFSRAPAAALSAGGRLTVVWPADNLNTQTTDIRARVFGLDLMPRGAETLVAAGGFSNYLDRPDVAALPGGDAIAVWARFGLDFSGLAIEGRRLGPSGAPAGAVFRIDQAADDLVADPSVAAGALGGFLVAWESFVFDADGDDVVARGFSAPGVPAGDEFTVHLQRHDIQDTPSVAAGGAGSYLVAFESRAIEGAGPGVYARAVTAAGPQGASESRANVAASSENSRPYAAAGGAGYAVVWQRAEPASSSVWLRSFNPAGVPQGSEQRINVVAGMHDGQPAVAGAGDLFVAWNRRDPDFDRSIVGRRYLAPAPGACSAAPTALCLAGGRFQVEVTWHDQHNGGDGVGTAVDNSDKTGFFWFFNPENIELVVKVLDATTVNGRFWVFYGALSDVEYTIVVTDVTTGERRAYHNDPGNICGRGDTEAFPLPAAGAATGGPARAAARLVAVPLPAPGTGAPDPIDAPGPVVAAGSTGCAADDEHLCLLGERFRVEVAWHDQHNGGDGVGHAVPFADKTGFFWFFNSANIELVVKVLDGRAITGHFWVFYGALSDVEYTLTVTDTAGPGVATYHNPPGNICGRGDTEAIPETP